MAGQKVGYIRVSTVDQNIDRQLEGIELHEKFIDHASAFDFKRPALLQMKQYVRNGDTLYVHSLDRLGRSVRFIHEIVDYLTEKGVTIHFVKENLIFQGKGGPQEILPVSKLILSVLATIAEFEYSIIRERQREGIAIAKKKGVYAKCGRKESLTTEQVEKVKHRISSGVPKAKVAREFGVSRQTIYFYLKEKIA